MFHYLRPHRRTPSTPSSPNPEQHSFEPPTHPVEHGHPSRFYGKSEDKLSKGSSSPLSPSIARVSSPGYGNTIENLSFNSKITTHGHDPRGQSLDNSKTNNGQKDATESGNHQKLPSYAGETTGNVGSMASKSQININQESNMKLRRPDSRFFGSSPDPDSKASNRKPAGTRMPSPPLGQSASNFEQPAPPPSGKARLKMLNPMALLARRKTSQAIPQLAPESLTSNLSSNDSFDPRIKGTVVHDFSAPRGPRRNVSYNDVSSADTTRSFQRSPLVDLINTDDPSRSVGNHTPVFTENFEEEQYPLAGPHVRKANDLSDLTLPKLPFAKESQRPIDQKSNINGHGNLQTEVQNSQNVIEKKSLSNIGPPVPPRTEEILNVESKDKPVDSTSTPPKAYPSSRKGRSRNVSEVSTKDIAGLPKHMKSTSSRFSFDMIGAAEQERLLEDRHRQKALEKKKIPDANENLRVYDEDEDFDYDAMMDDDGFEERIPGVNADYDDEDGFEGFSEDMSGMNGTTLEEIEEAEEHQELEQKAPTGEEVDTGLLDGNISAFTFQPYTMPSPLSAYSPGTATTPRDANGDVIGFAMTKNSPYLNSNPLHSVFTPVSPDANLPSEYVKLPEVHQSEESALHGLGIVAEVPQEPTTNPDKQHSELAFPPIIGLDDDDLYFDDGLIGLGFEECGDSVKFDESVFDNNDTDEYGRPLKRYSETQPTPNLAAVDVNASNTANGNCPIVEQSPISPIKDHTLGRLASQPSFSENNATSKPVVPAPQVTHGLTQDTLAAYQSALAAAAMSAAANGKFRRDSTQSLFPSASEPEETQPGLINDSGHTSSHYDLLSPSYDDDFDYDDALDDDEFIAAANAEALANDQDGFYGQEFGFYSQPAASSAEYINGGYFGPRGMEGLLRSQSGRIVSREPNLTPITERSEYSNRNSFMSQLHGLAGSSIGSPGLAQLMVAQDYENQSDMTLDALLKLRSRAWGGSQASLKSVGSNINGNDSPRSIEGSSSPTGGPPAPPWGHRRKGSAFSLVSEEIESEGDGDAYGEDMDRVYTNKSSPEIGKRDVETLDFKENDGEVVNSKKHKYTGSAESISYSKEDDPIKGERWVLERRRTAESGEVEVLGREILKGGVI